MVRSAGAPSVAREASAGEPGPERGTAERAGDAEGDASVSGAVPPVPRRDSRPAAARDDARGGRGRRSRRAAGTGRAAREGIATPAANRHEGNRRLPSSRPRAAVARLRTAWAACFPPFSRRTPAGVRATRTARFPLLSRRTPARTDRTAWLPQLPQLTPGTRARLRAARARLPRPLPVWWPLLLCALAGTLGGAGYGLVADREYAASGYVVVRQAEGSDPAGAVGNAQAFGRIATGDAVLTTAQADAGVTLAELRDGVRAATSPDAPMIEITGTATSGARAAEMANAVARALIAYGNDAAEITGARLTVFADAQPSAAPVSSTPLVRLAVGLVAGLVVGLLVLLVRTEGRDPAPAATAVPDQTPRTDRTGRPDGTDRADRTDRALRSLSPR
ncbi:hypothetical protein GCM10010417_32700 [Streptomyces carpaticus]